jgi:hypothetical protein
LAIRERAQNQGGLAANGGSGAVEHTRDLDRIAMDRDRMRYRPHRRPYPSCRIRENAGTSIRSVTGRPFRAPYDPHSALS